MPVMPLWTDRLIGDTTHLSAEQFGCYMLLLIATWRNNGQPFADNSAVLARICRIGNKKWANQMRAVLLPFFNLADGLWRQKRLEEEFRWASKRSATSRSNGTRGGRPKSLKINGSHNPAGSSQGNPDETQTYIHNLGSVSPGGDTGASAAPPADPIKAFWDAGLAILGNTKAARVLIGKMRQTYGDVAVSSAIAACQAELPSDPPSFFIRCCERHHEQHQRGGDAGRQQAYAELAQAAIDFDERQGNRGDPSPAPRPLWPTEELGIGGADLCRGAAGHTARHPADRSAARAR